MFRLHKLKSDKSRCKIDFNFSDIQALQVPKGWDKLFVSIILVETGKTIAKSGKASVRNGNCKWTDTLSESIWISQEDTTKELEQCLLKLVIAMGSVRSGILGEATVNLRCHMSSTTSVPVSLPLKKCSHGTTLQVKIQCLSSITNLRDEQPKDNDISLMEEVNDDSDDLENKSDVSDSVFTRSFESSSSNCLDSSSHLGGLGSRDATWSASGSHHSSGSMDGTSSKETFSPRIDLSGIIDNQIGRQDSNSSRASSPYASYLIDDPSRSNRLSFNSKVASSNGHFQNKADDSGRASRAIASSPLRNAGSSEDLLEAAELTIEELRAEARMWEQNARKLMLDLEKLRKQYSEQSDNQEKLHMNISSSRAECDGLKQEIEQLKILLEESSIKQYGENMNFKTKAMQKELEKELKYQKESNSDLAGQLQKTQESNIELVSILQELEETIEKQKMEIASLMTSRLESEDVGKYSNEHEDLNELNSIKEVLAERTRKICCDSDLEGSTVEPQRDLHTEFDPEKNNNLELKLQQLQESQKNLESTVHLLEKTLEDKNCEIEIEQGLRSQSLLDCDAEWRQKLATKEEEIVNLEAKFSAYSSAQSSKKMEFGDDCSLIKEIEALKEKVQELERDCNELTDENLELLLKLKEPGKDIRTCHTSSDSSFHKILLDNSPSNSDSEVSSQKSHICRAEELENNNLIEGGAMSHLKIQCIDLENKCPDLELQIQAFKDKASQLEDELEKFHAKAKEQEIEISSLQQRLECCQQKEAEPKDHNAIVHTNVATSDLGTADETSVILGKLQYQLQLFSANVKKQEYALCFSEDTECRYDVTNLEFHKSVDPIDQKEQIETMLKNVVQLNKFFDATIIVPEDELQCIDKIKERSTDIVGVPAKLVCNDPESFSRQGSRSSTTNADNEIPELSKEAMTKFNDIEEAKIEHLLKEDESEAVMQFRRESETQISNLLNEKTQLEQDMATTLKESSITSKCLESVRIDLKVLQSSIDSQVSANKILERKSSELESGKFESELYMAELEAENVQLTERISGLEAQVRYLTNERESTRLELHHSELQATSLQEDIRRLKTKLEAQKVSMEQKLSDMQNRWSETLDECEYLKKSNLKVQATAENLIEECSLLQKLNAELRNQKIELHKQYTDLEAELREAQKGFSNCSMKVDALEADLASMLEEVSLKEKTMNLELDELIYENKQHNEKLHLEESLLHQMYSEKKIEVESLQREVAYLTEQISATHEESGYASETVLEVSGLRGDKAKLEAALREVHGKLELSKNRFDALQMEFEAKVQALSGELATSKQKQEILMVDIEKLLGLLEEVKSNEQKLKSTVNILESKLKASEYERLGVLEEMSGLEVQLQKIAVLQDEILVLNTSLSEAKFEKERQEASFQLLFGDYEDLKSEKISLAETIASTQMAASELEDCKRSKVALQEKILRLEGDLTAREALSAQDAELKNELGRFRRTNSQFQRKIKCLEEEKEEWLQRAQVLEEELKQKTVKQNGHESSHDKISPSLECNATRASTHAELALAEVDNRQHCKTRSFQATRVDPVSNILLLRDKREPDGNSDAPEKLTMANVMKEEECELPSPLMAELRDLRERYFHMSLKYAEVEEEREELVMKLKAVNIGRTWFS